MMRPVTRLCMTIMLCLVASLQLFAQPLDEPAKKAAKPYRVLTSGKQVTIKSVKNIKNIMVWTATGHRIVEQRDVNQASFTFSVPGSSEKLLFLMVQYDGSKPITEKIGLQ